MRPFFCTLIALLLTCTAAFAQAPTTLRIGVAPHSSARVILEMYQPLRQHLETSLGMPVEVVTAPDFTEFARRMLAQEYDIAITTGHQARMGQTDAGYSPLLTYRADFRTVALVAGNSNYKTALDLKGKPVLGLSSTSLVTLWGQNWLKNNGNAEPLRYVSASDSVARLVLAGDAAAGFISLANYQSLARDIQPQLRFLVISDALAGRVYLLNKRDLPLRDRIDAALWSFADTPEGKAYFLKYKLEGYRKLKPRELEAMEPYAREVRQNLR
ncbi:phosphate/phosphite/phosphonate ABC transporter substrate-binding protein [Actimicrobium sp. CCC2.4]|uniref:phosphate/phosphite/phosphonate ABC transporter substrate-binding protein n=1 Tax=Actimicrobium sp. CCC2.4 TaxID=3048606 RepID=UPI002AC98687|nr:phosphate/phosphite/phosphonate ABC transporter substrate-binding protein [Actimicrobium sp. CCC2.4]MEB0136714.1 phosphate/phosphite/phosphonate ABC transporter substrate-binding protein [Actimicrobium sp. CCC2.4]WPX33178.1 phosphate/phosphite/phosphonate ABC transporter substrate-binding protein [Actimicrobium sp. CCC2.4]